MARSSIIVTFRLAVVLALLYAGVAGFADGPNEWQGRQGPVYQRRAIEHKSGFNDFRHKDRRFFHQSVTPNVQSGWFTRPYPYHLDYYKMRFGGSYAPYFGNLYGPPQVVTAPPYFGPYYGGFGFGDGFAQPNGFGGMPPEFPGQPGGVIYQGPNVEAAPNDAQPMQQSSENLPAPPE